MSEYTQPPLVPLPDLPGKVHGIVSLDPPTVQCDGCLRTYSNPHLGLAVLTSGINFNPRGSDGRRLCRDCAREAGWSEW